MVGVGGRISNSATLSPQEIAWYQPTLKIQTEEPISTAYYYY